MAKYKLTAYDGSEAIVEYYEANHRLFVYECNGRYFTKGSMVSCSTQKFLDFNPIKMPEDDSFV